MIFTLELITGPDIEPVTLAEMKKHLREYDSVTEMDAIITNLITGAREWVEGYTGRALVDQTWRLTVERKIAPVSGSTSINWPDPSTNEVLLRRSPVLSIESIVSIDVAGATTTIEPDTYQLRLEKSKWPKVVALSGGNFDQETVQIVYRAGYVDRIASPQQDANVIPARYKQAIKLWVQANYYPDDQTDALFKTAELLIRGEKAELSFA